MHAERICPNCTTPLTRRSGERANKWRAREHCNRACRDQAQRRAWVDIDGPPWRVDASGCWLWDRALGTTGYGLVRTPSGNDLAHRWVYEQIVGPIPAGLQIDHVLERGCTHLHCVNPAHLEPVEGAENIRRSRVAKLDLEAVRQIRERYRLGALQRQLADEFGVSRSAVSLIVNGHHWRD